LQSPHPDRVSALEKFRNTFFADLFSQPILEYATTSIVDTLALVALRTAVVEVPAD
jgi:hypothetical protein